MPKYKFSLVICARWEDKDILEWVEYHKSIGFNHIYLWSNDDTPDAIQDAVKKHSDGLAPFVTFNHWSKQGQQAAIYETFLEKYAAETEWFAFLDADEFLLLRNVNDIAKFMGAFEQNFDCIYFNWCVFGTSGRLQRESGSVLKGLTRRNRRIDFHTKNIVRSSKVSLNAIREGNRRGAKAYFHFWDDYALPDFRIADVLGNEIREYTKNFPSSAHAYCNRPGYQDQVIGTAICAHFQFKSEDDFNRRVARGGNSSQLKWKKMYDEGRHIAFLRANDEILDDYLAKYWTSVTGGGYYMSVDAKAG